MDSSNALEAYKNFEFGPGQSADDALMGKAGQEAGSATITLTAEGEEDEPAGGLTNAMRTWLQQSGIFAARARAIAAAQDAAAQVSLGRTIRGELFPVVKDKLLQKKAARQYEITNEYHQKNSQLLTDFERLDDEHDRMYVRHNQRKAKVPNHFLEWGLLFPLILIPESLLNYESFFKMKVVQSGAIALGLTIIVGLFIAVSGHLIGKTVAQFNFYWRADDQKRRGEFHRNWVLGAILLLIAISIIAYSRYSYIIEVIYETNEIEEGDNAPSLLGSIAGLLLGNIGIFVLGVIFARLFHDPDPEYSDKAREYRKIRKEKGKVENQELEAKLGQLNRRFEEDLEQAERMQEQLAATPDYGKIATMVSEIRAKDSELVGVLQAYKSELRTLIEAQRPDFVFDQYLSRGDRSVDHRRLSLADFETAPIKLFWS